MVKSIATNEILLLMLKNPTKQYNPLTISKETKITHSGAFKLLLKLEEEKFVINKKIGRYNYYRVNFQNKTTRKYLSFLIQQEKDKQSNKINMWINKISEGITQATTTIMFGSILEGKNVKDVDIVFVTGKNASKLYKEIDKINIISNTKIHPVIQTKEDLINNIRKEDPAIIKAIKGIMIFGDEEYFDILAEAIS